MLRFFLRKKLHSSWGSVDLRAEMEIARGEWLSLCGESGSGKTITLRMLAGLTRPDSGVIEFDGVTWYHSERGIFLPPQVRRVGFMFQDYALFPNMTVRQNLEFGLDSAADPGRISTVLDTMELRSLEHRHPALLSGGQKQRAALARALIASPRLLLLDEPLSALDPDMRERLQDELLKVRGEGTPGLLVTHDSLEAQKLGHRTLVLRAGYGGEASGEAPKTFLPYPLNVTKEAAKEIPKETVPEKLF